MSAENRVTLVVMGASGDLFKRLLLPGLASLLADRPELRVRLIGTGRSERSDEAWLEQVRGGLDSEARQGAAGRFLVEHTEWIQGDPTQADHVARLLERSEGRLLLYFALPPTVTVKVCAALQSLELPEDLKIVAEKPFGTDAASAAELNEALHQLVGERDIHRVDHFLGMSAVLNLLALRFSNRLLAGIWGRDTVESVDIVYDETLGLEGRAGFYDGTGALEDMLQSHLLQVLALVAMEQPAQLEEADLRSQLAQALRATDVLDDDPVRWSCRGRYTAGTVQGKDLPAYVEEDDVDPSLETETFAEVTFGVATERWAGVPFRLRSGKALAENRHELRLTLRPPAHGLPGLQGPTASETVVVELKTGAVSIDLTTNGRGDPFRLERTTLTSELGEPRMTPYGEVLRAAVDDDARLSVRGDVAVRCWEILAPVQRAWSRGEVEMQDYPAGSEGPTG